MASDDKIEDENLQYVVNREVAKTISIIIGKIEKYEYLAGK